LFLGAATCNVHAQFATKNVIELGGSISYSSTTIVTDGTAASESSSIFQFLPYVNYFVTNGFSVAISPGINIVKLAGTSESITNYLLFLVPGYTFSTKSDVFPYIEGMVGYTALSSKANPLAGTGEIDLSGISFGAKGGIKVLVGKNGLISVGVSYILLNLSAKGADKRSGFNNLAFSLGWSVFLEK
jgi:hypothetical protein